MSKRTWFEIVATGPHAATLEIFDEIGAHGVTFQEFSKQLRGLGDVREILLRLNSPGGSVQDGVGIFNELTNHPAKVTVEIVGWALSIASYIAMAGNHVRMAANGLLMIHNPWMGTSGDSAELRQAAEMLDKTRDTMLAAYGRKSGKQADEIAALLAAETWFSADEALAAGFIDEIIAEPHEVLAAFDPAKLPKIPSRYERSHPMNLQTQSQPTQTDIQAALAADQQRRTGIRTTFAKWETRDGVQALRQQCEDDTGCTLVQARERLLEALGADSCSVAGNYFVDVSGPDDRLRDVLQAGTDALLIRAGIKLDNPSPLARDFERTGILGMAERMLSIRGKSTRDMGRNQLIKAALSTSDFPELLSNTFGKSMRLGYENEPGTHALWTAEREVSDFKPQSFVALSEAPDLELVEEGAEYTYGTFGESAESFSVKTYGRIVSITRQALVNDDLSAFTRIPAAFGSAARRKEADLIYARLTGSQAMSDGNPLFHINHGNLAATGADLNLESLAAARAAMRRQKGVSGLGLIDPQPRYLIVPVALETLAEQLLSEIVVPGGSSEVAVAWVRGLQVIADPRLDAVSETAWYLAASPLQMDTICRAYLSGQPRPYYEENDAFIRDELQMKCRHDFGVGVIDYRGLYKNPGA